MKRFINIILAAVVTLSVSGASKAASGIQAQAGTDKNLALKAKKPAKTPKKKKAGRKHRKTAAYECLSVYDPDVRVDRTPQFRGGDAGLFNFISTNLHYPKKAEQQGVQGRVLVRFAIDPDGRVRDVEVVESLDRYLDAEAARVVKSLPKFKPAINDGKPVKFFYTLPVNFKLQ